MGLKILRKKKKSMLFLIANLTNAKDILKSRIFLQEGRIKMLPTKG